MAQRTRRRYMTRKLIEGANRLVELCIASMRPNVVADVSARPRLLTESIQWTYPNNRLFEYLESKLNPKNRTVEPKDTSAGLHPAESRLGRLFWTHEGMLGRLKGMSMCHAFNQGSLVDRIALFMTSEVNIGFLDLRTVFQYIYGVNDTELYAAIKELIRQSVVGIASVRNQDSHAVGPFTLHACTCSKESYMNSYDDEQGKANGTGTWFNAFSMTTGQLDALLMRMFAYCRDNLYVKEDTVEPFNRLKQCYDDENSPLDNCCDYLHKLLMIKTRSILADEYDITDIEYENQFHFIQLLDNTIHRNIRRIQKTAKDSSNPDEYIYIPNTMNIPPAFKETADESDIETAIRLLEENMDSLRKDNKTGKVINAEKVRYVFEVIPKVFSLKTLYEIFRKFDTEAEVVRRDVRALCRKSDIVAVDRGMYCSRKYAHDHFSRIGRNPAEEDTILESCVNTAMKNLATAMDLLSKSLSNLVGNNENQTDDSGSATDDDESLE